jgi:gliding motility-associated transport system permease protein
MWNIYLREINSFLNSSIAYLVIGVFLILTGLFVWVFPETNILVFGYANVDPLFFVGPYVFLFLIPAITMRSFAEEKKTGTVEFLFTRPLKDFQIIVSKFFASWTLAMLALIPTIIYYFSVYYLGYPVGNVDTAGVVGSYLGLVLLSGVFCSVGILASSTTENQIVSFIISVFICFIFYSGFQSLSQVNIWGPVSPIIQKLGISYHYESMSRGLIDSRDILYFFSLGTIILLVTNLIFKGRKW